MAPRLRLPRRGIPAWLALIFVLGAALTTAPELLARDIEGRVVHVADGDTVTVLTPDRREIKVRLAEIDTPERGQPWGRKAREALAGMIAGEDVRVRVVDTDRYGRTVGRIWRGDLDVNAALVAQGHAWVYRRYARDPELFTLEQAAREAGRGLWGLPEAERVPPWEWRRR